MRAALYLRVSTTDQTTENQERELRAAAIVAGFWPAKIDDSRSPAAAEPVKETLN